MSKMKCTYPDCFNCPYTDCVVEEPQKRKRYHDDLEKSRIEQRNFREQKRLENGIKTMKEIQIEKQNEIYKFMVDFTVEHLYPPSTMQIQSALDIKGNAGVTRDLRRLEERGLIKIGKGARQYKLLGYELVKKEGASGE